VGVRVGAAVWNQVRLLLMCWLGCNTSWMCTPALLAIHAPQWQHARCVLTHTRSPP
jgi:hypothetical protein